MLIQCLIERDGDTTVTRGGVNYVFRQNKQGHAVCEVQNDDHARLFLRMGSKVYRPYGQQAELHAKRLKMVPERTATEEIEEDGEIFEESVGIVEGREESATAVPTGDGEEEGLFAGVESAEETAVGEPDTAEADGDALVQGVAARLLSTGTKRAEVAAQIQKQFGLSAEEAKQTVAEVAKK